MTQRRRKTRDEMLLEEQYTEGVVETGFQFGFEAIDSPPRIHLSIIGSRSGDGMNIWFEREQFAAFVDAALRTMPLTDAMAVIQGMLDPDQGLTE